MENLNYLDAALGAIVILSTLIGLTRGLIKEMLSLIAWLAAIYVAWLFAERVAHDYITQFINDPLISYMAAFGLLFIGTLFVIGLVNLVITQLVVGAGLGFVNRFLGMLFGFARGLVIGALVVFVIGLTPLTKENWWQESQMQPYFKDVGDWAWKQLPPNIQKLLRSGTEKAAEAGIRLGNTPQAEDNGQSRLAERPENRVPREQRNAISDMSEAELRLESLSNEHPLKQPSNAENNEQENTNTLSTPPLQLESVQ